MKRIAYPGDDGWFLGWTVLGNTSLFPVFRGFPWRFCCSRRGEAVP